MLHRSSLGVAVVFLAASALSAAGKIDGQGNFDWPQWRGPNRDANSTETGLLKEWPKEGPPLAWKAEGLGKGYATVSVAAGKIFTMGDLSGQSDTEYLLALDEAKGTILWKAPVGETWSDGGPRCTPTVAGDLVYALGPDGDLVCVQVSDGKERWRKNMSKNFGGHMMSHWGYSESPLVDGNQLVCTPGGRDATLVALNKDTGELIWKAKVPGGDGAGYASIVVAEVDGVRQYVQLLGGGIVGVAAKDGKFLWRYNKVANHTANIPTAIVKDNFVFCSSGYNTGSALLKLSKTDAGFKAEEVYFLKSNVFQNHHGGMVLVGNHIYGGHGHNNGQPTCVDLKTGMLAWQQKPGPGSRSASVVYADGELYFRYENGVMALIDATPDGYKQRGTFKLPDKSRSPSWPHPVVANGKLYIRDQDKLLCFDVKKH